MGRRKPPLPPPDSAEFVSDNYIAPANTIEKIIAKIWMKIIGTPQVGRNDNFLNLGGDSILNIRMNSQIRHVFNMHVDNSTVFNNPTLAGFAAVIAEQLAKGE
ncbi:hypothetical protein GEA64_05575 [Photorhabdus khanii]|uniref:Carrier domain-containing protein n=1 Tax=Photorhabdus khanii TaxID=1004150 RepID=A0A7C9GI43_9GAMM|nr:phosphopantetheine-binding protein [Photorhabdus khanii]MQL47493.1 hypothetical protein [Photorhabdus khanii]